MNFDPIAESAVVQHPDKQNRSLIVTSWGLIGLGCLIGLLPFFGFGSWFIVGAILFIPLVLGIIILARGERLPGLAILLSSLVAAPVLMLVVPSVLSLLGLGGTVAGGHTAVEIAPQTNTDRPGEYEQLKAQIQAQAEPVTALKSNQLVSEGVHGYLIGDERLTIEQRHLVQQENVWRERIFEMIGRRTGHSREEIAAIFADMAKRSAVNPKPTRAD